VADVSERYNHVAQTWETAEQRWDDAGDIAGRLRNLAELCDLAQAHPEYVQPASGLRWVRDHLRALATEVGE